MRSLKYFFTIGFLFFNVYCLSQEIKYVETKPDVNLYEVPSDVHFPATERNVYQTYTLKEKRIKKPKSLQIVDLSNLSRNPDYDAYVVRLSNKLYFLRSSDVVDNSFLLELNRVLSKTYKSLEDSVKNYSQSGVALKNFLGSVDTKIEDYEDSIRYYNDNRNLIIREMCRADVRKRHKELSDEYSRRREKYFNWVSTLPKSVQKDANLLAIPEHFLDGGYSACDYKMAFINMSTKTIKYLIWSGKIKNAVGDYVSCQIRHKSSFSGKYTGPCLPHANEYYYVWDAVIFNSSADRMILNEVKIFYTDGTSVVIGKQSLDYITNIPEGVFDKSPSKYSLFPFEDDNEYNEEREVDSWLSMESFYLGNKLDDKKHDLEDKLYLLKRAKEDVLENRDDVRIMSMLLSQRKYDILWKDADLKELWATYMSSTYNDDEITRRYKEFKNAYFGFLDKKSY